MRVLVTGDNGLLGSTLAPMIRRDHQMTGVNDTHGDIADADFVNSVMDQARPDTVVHLAAYTAVDHCEQDPAEAFRVNKTGTAVVAQAAANHKAHLIAISTDYVFDGSASRAYTEQDETGPLNVYGESKLASEEAAKLAGRWTVFRSAWLFGPHRRNFVTTILGLLESKPSLTVVDDQVGSPTYTLDLARAVLAALENRVEGLFHAAGAGRASWCDLAKEAVRLVGGDPARIQPGDTEGSGRPAPRPPFSVLDSSRLKAEVGCPPRNWREALADYVAVELK